MSEPTARPWAARRSGIIVDGVKYGQVGACLAHTDAPVGVALADMGIEIVTQADRGTFAVGVTISRSDAEALANALLALVR